MPGEERQRLERGGCPGPPCSHRQTADAGCGPIAPAGSLGCFQPRGRGTHGAGVMPRSTSMVSCSPVWGMSDRDSSVTLTELIGFLLEQK